MPTLKTYDLFISHAWRYNGDYYRLEKMLNEASYFYWRNYSVPEHDPKIDPNSEVGKQKLYDELKKQIRPVNCVIILAGMYAYYSYWINKEIEIALKYNKPILAVKPWGQERVPQAILDVADEIVGWNTSTIIDAIRRISI